MARVHMCMCVHSFMRTPIPCTRPPNDCALYVLHEEILYLTLILYRAIGQDVKCKIVQISRLSHSQIVFVPLPSIYLHIKSFHSKKALYLLLAEFTRVLKEHKEFTHSMMCAAKGRVEPKPFVSSHVLCCVVDAFSYSAPLICRRRLFVNGTPSYNFSRFPSPFVSRSTAASVRYLHVTSHVRPRSASLCCRCPQACRSI